MKKDKLAGLSNAVWNNMKNLDLCNYNNIKLQITFRERGLRN